MGLITTLILLPLIGVIAALAIPSADRDAARGRAAGSSRAEERGEGEADGVRPAKNHSSGIRT